MNLSTGTVPTDTETPHLLLVEDDESQAFLFMRVLRRDAGAIAVAHVPTAEQAWDVLEDGADSDREPPRAVIVDLRLPGAGGLSLVERIRGDARLQTLPVVVFSSSATSEEIRGAFDMRANSFLRKPTDFVEYVDVANQIGTYWGVWNKPA